MSPTRVDPGLHVWPLTLGAHWLKTTGRLAAPPELDSGYNVRAISLCCTRTLID
jgi:hypothetical protein